MDGKIAYIMSRFPHLPETFILREMGELKRQGWNIALYPLIHQEQAVMHAEAKEWLQQARYSQMLSLGMAKANVDSLGRHPSELAAIWRESISENASDPGFLLRTAALLPLAVDLAQKMQAEGIDHIHAHYATHPALVAWAIHRLTGIPYSVTVHAHDIFVSKAMLATKLREADFIVAISEYNREFLSKTLGSWISEKTNVIHCGIDPDLYSSGSHCSDLFHCLFLNRHSRFAPACPSAYRAYPSCWTRPITRRCRPPLRKPHSSNPQSPSWIKVFS